MRGNLVLQHRRGAFATPVRGYRQSRNPTPLVTIAEVYR